MTDVHSLVLVLVQLHVWVYAIPRAKPHVLVIVAEIALGLLT